MLSNKCKYAIRAVLYLAVNSSKDGKFSTGEIAEELRIPEPFLGKILQELVRKKVISSSKGPRGGSYLTDKDLDSTIFRIIEVIDGLGIFTSCVLGLEKCSDNKPCPIHRKYKSFRDNTEDLFRNKSIKEISKDIEAREIYLA